MLHHLYKSIYLTTLTSYAILIDNKRRKQMKRTVPYDFESYSAIATDPRGIVQSMTITKQQAHDLVAQGYMMPFDQWETMLHQLNPRQPRWNFHKGEWAQAR